MKNIVLTRIDDRLIHGQVVTAWIKQYPINKILIIDDELSQNRLMERIYKAAAPMGVEVLIQSVSEAREFLKEEPVKGENFLILVKVPEIIESLLKEGIEIKKVILAAWGPRTAGRPLTGMCRQAVRRLNALNGLWKGEWKSFISWFRMIRPLTSEACFSEAGQNLIWRR